MPSRYPSTTPPFQFPNPLEKPRHPLDSEHPFGYTLPILINTPSLETQEQKMPFSVVVLCVLCASVVKTPFAVHPLQGTRAVPARISTTSRSTTAHYRRDVGYQCGAFSALRATPNSVDPFQSHDMIKNDVNKCTYPYGQPSSSALHHPTQNNSNVRKCGVVYQPPAPAYLSLLHLMRRRKEACNQLSSFLAHPPKMCDDSELIDVLATLEKSV
jgi:hypothetical protein